MRRSFLKGVLVWLIIPYGSLFAQSEKISRKDTISRALINLYHAQLGQQSPLFNGPEPSFYKSEYRGSPNFDNQPGFLTGWVIFGKDCFENVPLKFDEFADQLISKYYTTESAFVLRKDLVAAFGIGKAKFIQALKADSLTSRLPAGFYQVLHEGRHTALVKRSRNIGLYASNKDGINYFIPKAAYYMKKDNEFHLVTSTADIRKLYAARGSELQRFLRANALDFRANPDRIVEMVAAWYDSKI